MEKYYMEHHIKNDRKHDNSALSALLKCGYVTIISNLSMEMSGLRSIEIRFMALSILGYIVIMMVFGGIQELLWDESFQHVYHDSMCEYFKEIYNTKPEILKKKNTGFVTDMLSRLVNLQSELYLAITWYIIYGCLYIGYAAYKCYLIHWSVATILLFSILFSIILLVQGKQFNRKYMKESNAASSELVDSFMIQL